MTKQMFRGETLEVVKVGAEAVLIKGYFIDIKAIYKVRLPKPYMDPRLSKLLIRERTAVEAKVIHDLKVAGVPVPTLLYVSIDDGLIVMEYIEGELLKNIIGSKESLNWVRKLGRYVAVMHRLGITHGDLTTSNVIIKKGRPYIIDFGLSRFSNDLEDKGVDIHLFLRALESTHYELKDKVFQEFMKGYREVAGDLETGKVLRRMHEIRLRGRYVEERRRKA